MFTSQGLLIQSYFQRSEGVPLRKRTIKELKRRDSTYVEGSNWEGGSISCFR